MRVTRLELVRSKLHRILSPRCLPIPPHPQRGWSQLREVGSWLPHFQKHHRKKEMIGAERGTRTLTSCSRIPDSKSGASSFRHFRISKCREIYFIKSVELKWYNIFYIPSFKTLTLRMRFTLLFIYFDRSLTTSYISKTIGITPRLPSPVVV